MRKFTSIFIFTLALIIGTLFQSASAQVLQATPDANTKNFYIWYIKLQSKLVYPLLDNDIYQYVEKRAVDSLRKAYRHERLPGDSDYFTKVQDYNEDDWVKHIVTHPAIMLGDTAVIAVTFGSKDKVSVIVFLRKQGAAWKIIKVDDTQVYL